MELYTNFTKCYFWWKYIFPLLLNLGMLGLRWLCMHNNWTWQAGILISKKNCKLWNSMHKVNGEFCPTLAKGSKWHSNKFELLTVSYFALLQDISLLSLASFCQSRAELHSCCITDLCSVHRGRHSELCIIHFLKWITQICNKKKILLGM